MSYRSSSYRPSASLIHELRMIAQSFFQQRTTTSIFGRSQPKVTPLLCIRCLQKDKIDVKAVAMMNGHSLCKKHVISGIDRG